MRIGLVTAYDLSRDGGVNRQALGLARALRDLGDDVLVLGPASGPVPQGCVGLAGVVGVPGNGSMAHIGLGVQARSTLRFVREHRFDLLHLHAPLIPGPSRQAAAYATLPMVATFHASTERESLGSWCVRRMARGPLRRLRAAMAVSQVAKAFSQVLYQGPMHVIPCGIRGADFSSVPGPVPQLDAAHPLRILFVGRFCEPRKGLRVLLQAAAQLRRAGRLVEVTVAGSGRHEKFASWVGPAQARFVGRLGDRALARAYCEADIFCAPSLGSESFGLVLIEAMATGCPVVASRIPGYVEAARGGAHLVAPGDADALAAALWHVGSDPKLRAHLRQAATARAAALDWRHVAPRVRQVYCAALAA